VAGVLTPAAPTAYATIQRRLLSIRTTPRVQYTSRRAPSRCASVNRIDGGGVVTGVDHVGRIHRRDGHRVRGPRHHDLLDECRCGWNGCVDDIDAARDSMSRRRNREKYGRAADVNTLCAEVTDGTHELRIGGRGSVEDLELAVVDHVEPIPRRRKLID